MVLKVGMTKSEIEKEIVGKGTFVQVDWLVRFLKEPLTMEMKKFIFQKLADTYEKINMCKEAGKMYDNMANLSITFVEKIRYYMREVEMYVRGGDVNESEEAMKKALSQANSVQRDEIYRQVVDFYKRQGDVYDKSMKRAYAVQIYEKLLQMRINDMDRKEVKDKLLLLYEKLGRRKEFHALERR